MNNSMNHAGTPKTAKTPKDIYETKTNANKDGDMDKADQIEKSKVTSDLGDDHPTLSTPYTPQMELEPEDKPKEKTDDDNAKDEINKMDSIEMKLVDKDINKKQNQEQLNTEKV